MARAEARAEQVSPLDLALADGAEEVLLDDVRLIVLDPGEAIRDA
jgi:hypothetical protein